MPRLEKEARTNKERAGALAAAVEAREVLDTGRTVFGAGLDREPLRELSLLTAKPFLYVFNLDDAELSDAGLRADRSALVAPAEAIFLDAKLEAELVELDDADALELLQSSGQTEPGLAQLARVGFATLGLQTYLTAGPKESRAWTIRRGATAPEAAGVIHTDFQRGFIKAEIVSFADLVDAGSMAEAKSRGQGPHRGQGLRHGRRRRRRVPLQRLTGAFAGGDGRRAVTGPWWAASVGGWLARTRCRRTRSASAGRRTACGSRTPSTAKVRR